MKNNNIPEYILCPTPELARQVLEKIERESDLTFYLGSKPTSISNLNLFSDVVIEAGKFLSLSTPQQLINRGITNFTKAEDFLNNNYMTNKTWDNLNSCECERCSKCGKLVNR